MTDVVPIGQNAVSVPPPNKLIGLLGAGTARWPTQAQCRIFYGDPAHVPLVHVKPPFELYYDGKPYAAGIAIHQKCAASLEAVLQDVWARCGKDQKRVDAAGISVFSGSYALRSIRGSGNVSMHSYGAAVDFDAEHNPMCRGPGGTFTSEHPLVQAFKKEGWIWGGDWSGRRDPMHFQAARVR